MKTWMVGLLQQDDLATEPAEEGRRRTARRAAPHDEDFALTVHGRKLHPADLQHCKIPHRCAIVRCALLHLFASRFTPRQRSEHKFWRELPESCPLGGLRSCSTHISEAAAIVEFSAPAFEMAEPRCDAYRALSRL